MENDRLNEIRELNPDYDISMHELDVCVGDNQYRLMYYVYVQHKDHYETFAVVPRGKSKLQVYMTISNGTNGAEGCIINPMEDVLNVLKDLRKCKGVTWSQLLEVGIDNADDLYWWYVTFSIDTTAI